MNSNKLLIYLCFIFVSVEALHFFIYTFEVRSTPELLHAYKNHQYSNLPSWWNYISTIVLAMLVAKVVSIIGIILLKSWARYLFVISIIIPNLTHLLLGYFVVGPFSGLTISLINILAGVIIGISFFSESKYAFK